MLYIYMCVCVCVCVYIGFVHQLENGLLLYKFCCNNRAGPTRYGRLVKASLLLNSNRKAALGKLILLLNL
jgi:hypothetical protein